MSVNFFAQGLRNMLPQAAVNGGKHSTMDSVTQNMALQQLRGSAAVADAQTRLMSLQGCQLVTITTSKMFHDNV